ncbi:inositol monophosphatase family protein [Halapricum desulfuricans]|uniref:fructose-bisphosphatase n=1 Tax=Halapricum desulfuricans TaxID=2841257 RepID=A0A897N066_9EURY|nr:inositol monophosphatase family protein [Halapricum desulfuricans]QSG04529.1 Archaeal fructose-1,6-bisphosphatase or related enzyme of inositol monophosphatase family [Halapricum desulfuricans]
MLAGGGAAVGTASAFANTNVLGALNDGAGTAQLEIDDLEGQLPIEDRYLRIGVLATAKAAQLHQNYFGKIGEAEEKDPQNLLTQVDIEAEELIRETIEEELGDDFQEEGHVFYGEEQGGTLEGDFVWIIDPLDGTTNFSKGIPHFGVNLAITRDGELYAGVMYYSLRDEVYVAVKGKGAYKFRSDGYDLVAEDSEPEELSVTDVEAIEDSFHGVGFYLKETANDYDYMGVWRYLFANTQGTRLLGAAAPDLAFVGEGVFDTVSVKDLKPVDVAPEVLIVREAGGKVTDFEGNEDLESLLEGSVIATNGYLHDDFFELLEASNKSWLTRPIENVTLNSGSGNSSTSGQ